MYNIGASEERSNLAVAESILQRLGKSRDLIRQVADRAGHDRRYALDAGKLESRLGWNAEQSFAEGLESTVGWYQENEAWWKRIKNAEFWQYYQKAYKFV